MILDVAVAVCIGLLFGPGWALVFLLFCCLVIAVQ